MGWDSFYIPGRKQTTRKLTQPNCWQTPLRNTAGDWVRFFFSKWEPCLFLFSVFCPTDMTHKTIQKSTTATISCLKTTKNKNYKWGFPFVCTCGPHTRLRFLIESRKKIEWGMAGMPLVIVTTCFMCRNRFLVISLDGLTNWAVRLILIVSLCLQGCLHQVSLTMIFLAVVRFSCQNLGKNQYLWGMSGISARPSRILKMVRPVCTLFVQGQRFRNLKSKLQWFTRYIRPSDPFSVFLARPARMFYSVTGIAYYCTFCVLP